jgi:hypothetical protein
VFVAALLAFRGAAFAVLQLAFQRGGALATAGVATLFASALPIAAFVVVAAGAAALARPEEPTERLPAAAAAERP